MSQRALINSIESFSTTLNQKQLMRFLDIMDEMAELLNQAQNQPSPEQMEEVKMAQQVSGVH
ncbi:hypothetical protein [Lacimicrobium alkaliphilum]|uniref:Uncharacterized protein n=1 Tax=Lacimicrobium alkaliphilum TaxID=1526571 RepID=A0A0U3B0N0_9ALTE|nr:hypothetical protein [Lacimicrobium alkaliphilum]ALS97081.1 hypothetical protein AT746_01480 [Lacimicrobium alkaliphilum]